MSQQEPNDANTTVQALIDAVAAFRDERDWSQFHAPKSLSMSIAIEAAELMEPFQWVDLAESRALVQEPRTRQAIAEELADVLAYCLSFASIAGLDITTIVRAKMAANAAKYPVERFKGKY